MDVIIGGCFQGKLSYALEKYHADPGQVISGREAVQAFLNGAEPVEKEPENVAQGDPKDAGQAGVFPGQAEAFQRQAGAFPGQTEAFQTQTETVTRQAEVFQMQERAFSKQIQIVNALQEGIREAVMAEADMEKLTEWLLAYAKDKVIICDEVGYGIVPMEKTERIYREQVGRVMCALTAQAGQVTRIVAGLPVILKG